jgi:hypothetical protein
LTSAFERVRHASAVMFCEADRHACCTAVAASPRSQSRLIVPFQGAVPDAAVAHSVAVIL